MNTRVELLQAAGGADEGPAGAKPGDEVRDAPGGLLPDFHRRAIVVRLPVGGVVVLVGIKIGVGVLGVELPGFADGAVGAFGRVGQDQLCPVSLENSLALQAGVGRQAEPYPVAAGRAQQSVGDAGVAGGGVQNNLAGGELPAALAFQNHVERRAVFDRAAGVEPLRLEVELHLRELAPHPRHAQQRRVTHALGHRDAQRQLDFSFFGQSQRPSNALHIVRCIRENHSILRIRAGGGQPMYGPTTRKRRSTAGRSAWWRRPACACLPATGGPAVGRYQSTNQQSIHRGA